MNYPTQFGITARAFLIFYALGFFAVCESARAVVPPPDGGYPGFNTAEGQNALFNLTTGIGVTKSERTTADQQRRRASDCQEFVNCDVRRHEAV